MFKIICLCEIMAEKNYFSAAKQDELNLSEINRKKKFEPTEIKHEQFRTLQNGIVLEKLESERNFSAKKKNKKDYDSNNFSADLQLAYKTISVPPKKKQIPKTEKKNDETINLKFEKNLKEIECSKKETNFTNLYNRLMTFNESRKQAIEEMKKQKEIGVDKQLRKVPLISEKSKNLVRKNEEPFYERCVKFKNEVERKKSDMREEKEEKKKKAEDEIIKEVKSHRLEKEKINEKIAKLLVWDSKKREKLTHMKENIEKKNNVELTFHPKINKTPVKYKQNVTPNKLKSNRDKNPLMPDSEITERLYTKDIEKRKIKLENLESIYMPSFEPMTNRSKLHRNRVERDLTPKVNKTDQKIKKTDRNNFDQLYNKTIEDENIQNILKEKMNFKRKIEYVPTKTEEKTEEIEENFSNNLNSIQNNEDTEIQTIDNN